MPRLTHSRIIAALIFIIAFIILCCVANAQSTTVSATVVDLSGTVWANGSWKLDFIPNPNYSINNVNWNGAPFPTSQWHYAGALNSSGVFSQSVPANNFITPVGSTYTVSVCPNASSPCSVITGTIIQGTTLDLSSTITSATPAPKVLPLPLARAYNDAEVNVNTSMVGYFYMRVTDNQPRYWGQDGVWHSFISGVNTFSAGNLTSLFTTSVGADPQNPNLQFTKVSVNPLTVYANCTSSTASPLFCAITAGMLPATITSDTTGAAARLSGTPTACSNSPFQLFTVGITNTGNSNCTQVLFPAIGGNINVSQMNSGTNADASHYFVGGNSGLGQWLPIPAVSPVVTQSQTVTGCTPASSTDSGCTGTITLSPAMADTSYQVFLQVNSINGAFLSASVSGALTTTTVPYTITCSFNCATVVAPTLYVFARHP